MKTFFKITLALLLMLSISNYLMSCRGDDGADGKDGKDGTANVIYSDWIIGPTLTDETIDETSGKSGLIDAPLLSQDIIDKGTVLVYAKFSSTILVLPYTSRAGGIDNTLTYFPMLQKIKLFRFKHDGSGGLYAAVSYRYILIPGGVKTTGKNVNKIFTINNKAYTEGDLKKLSYDEASNLFNIKN